ncbi:IclR family transcriptional regulator C-terminal domain-containing protein [Corynebacterium suedekumii]|uniref:IclR family transcriptional regulator C-terminal domain-containing protein n=1 Tax=Corynebacterium suedekumii TaxID=3049801 RepID=A0ABY8VRI5_9CORY|nr:IclR family transcriptional regulator C-terminal domain-containing protein [Corynebacterium suedekumii]WIM71631.1 IclR family transcriptional regulator C-terminal domain-containing protein [Corynebacterium suedekumii]
MMAWDENLTERTIEKGFSRWTRNTITDPDEFRQVLAQVREEGLAYDREEISAGLSCVAAPIFGRGPVPVAAMSVSGPTATFTAEDHIPGLRRITAAAPKAYKAAVRE